MDDCGAGVECSKSRHALWLIVLAVFFPGLAGSAEAATLQISFGDIQYNALAGETNQLTVTGNGTDFVFAESGAVAIAAMPPCVNLLAGLASCPAAGIDEISAGLGDMNDVASYDASVGSSLDQVGFDAGDGNDILSGAGPTAGYLLGRAGNDVVTGGDGDDDIRTMEGNDAVSAGVGDDFIRPGPDADIVNAGPGNDRFGEESAPDPGDILDAGAGLGDSIDLRGRTGPLNVSLNGVADDGEPGEADNLTGFERIDSGDGNDILTGGPEPNSFLSNAGDDVLNGGPGPDDLSGGDGGDVLNGGPGSDVVRGGNGSDQQNGGDGDDQFQGEFADDGADAYSGGSGTDSIDAIGNNFARAMTIDLDGIADDGPTDPVAGVPADNARADIENLFMDQAGEGGEGLVESASDDILTGNSAANQIDGGAGDDQIKGLGGPDALLGGPGDDNLDGGTGIDAIDGGGGSDSIRSRDFNSDEVSCGSSDDALLADRFDDFTVTCDQSSTGALLKSGFARLNRKKKARLKVNCPAAEGIACEVKITAKKGKKTLAKGSGKVNSGKTGKVTVKLTRAGRKTGSRKLKLKAKTVLTDATGAKTATIRPKLVLKR